MRTMLLTRLLGLSLAIVGAAGCTVKQTQAPAVSGPSEFALSFGLTASPDSISQDGGSQSQIAVIARGPNGEAKSGVTFRLAMYVSGMAVDYGTLSSKTVTTGSDGRVTVSYTSPSALPAGTNLPSCSSSVFNPGLPGGCVSIVATPVGTNYTNSHTESVEIHLVPLGVILPPAATPTAKFTFAPATPAANAAVAFDASSSCAGQIDATGCPSSAGSISSYAWSFGDGSSGSGRTVSHSYSTPGNYSVTLTVTNDRGVAASTTLPLSVGAGALPTADFVFSPTAPAVLAEVYFDASSSKAGIGHRVVTYKWNWGDGDPIVSGSGPTQSHDYLVAGTYTVTLVVVDEAGQEGNTSKTVTVGTGVPTVSFITSVTNAGTHTIQADGSASSALSGATISKYDWSWGDGTTSPNAASVASHTYGAAGTYTVKLTVTDSLNRVGIATSSVTVP